MTNQLRTKSSIAPVPRVGIAGQPSYLDVLEEAWAAHLAPREEAAPTVISTFAGAGGSSLGYSMTGYRELLAVEWDDNAVATFHLNFPDVPVYHGDIAKLSVEECLERAGIAPGDLDVLDGSPPCQGFSVANTDAAKLGDPRNQLFYEYIRLLRGLRPKVFVAENVSGMVKGKMKLLFAEILRELKASGYKVSVRLMNAMYFHVPQSRERMIFVGVREDLGVMPSHPRALSHPITVRSAFEGLQVGIEGLQLTPLYAQYWRAARMGGTLGRFRTTTKLHPDRPAYTMVKSEGNGGMYHPFECRKLHIREFMRLASFPDAFRFTGTRKDMTERIGNSVPPLFMRAIAQHIRERILTCERVEP